MTLTFRKLLALPILLALAGVLPAHAAQNSVALSYMGTFPTATSSSTTNQNPSQQSGFMIEMRHISNPLMGYDISYSFRRANQGYSGIGINQLASQAVHADAHALTLNYVVSLHALDFRPFALIGGGFQKFNPTGTQTGATQSQTKALFDYGVGLDWTVLPHIGLRFQYRNNVYKAPQLATAFRSTGKLTRNAEPMIGAYFNF